MTFITDLPPEYQKLANHNIKHLPSGAPTQNVLISAFNWKDSSEGHDFWKAVWDAETEQDLPLQTTP